MYFLNGWWVMVQTSSKWGKFGCDLIFDLEGQGRSLHKTKGTITKLFCTFGPNLVILAWMDPELSRGQISDWHTDWHTHRHTYADNGNIRRPKLASGNKEKWILRFYMAVWIHTYMHSFSSLYYDIRRNDKTKFTYKNYKVVERVSSRVLYN